MSKATDLETRMRIWQLSQSGQSDRQIAREVGYAVPTVRKWRRRAQRGGRAGLATTMGRPPRGALSTFPAAMREDIYNLRTAHPGWGPNTLVAELEADRRWQDKAQPSRSGIARYLKEKELTRRYERHTKLAEPAHTKAAAPHDVWQVDARGDEYVPHIGKVALINAKDVCSRARLVSYPTPVGKHRHRRHPKTEDYQTALRLAFTDWGLPRRVHVDHASVFFDNTTKSPYPTRMHQWLVALGIEVTFSRRHRATDQGAVERSHQLWEAQVLQGQSFDTWEALVLALRSRRGFLNNSLPCAPLDGLPPLLAYPGAAHSGRYYRPEWEADLLDLDRLVNYLSRLRWFRKIGGNGTLSIGCNISCVGKHLAGQQVEVRLEPLERVFQCFNEQGDLVACSTPKNLTKEYLMGLEDHLRGLAFFQLALPFPGVPREVIRLFGTMDITT